MNSAEFLHQMSTQTQVTDQADQQKGKNVSPVRIFGSSEATHADKSSHAMPFPKILMRMGMEIVSNARVGLTCVGHSVEGVKTKYFRDKIFFGCTTRTLADTCWACMFLYEENETTDNVAGRNVVSQRCVKVDSQKPCMFFQRRKSVLSKAQLELRRQSHGSIHA